MADMELRSKAFEVEDDVEAVFEDYYARGWTDGLPIVPPTPARVRRMIEAGGRPASEVVAVLPPLNAPATVEKTAINGVMAGCHPTYFPVLLTIVEALGDPGLDLLGLSTTTNHVWLVSIVNGPIRRQLDINCGYGVMGPGWRANATIGRATRFVHVNIAGARPGEVSKSTHGHPGRYTMCLGEYEEKSPWEPLHVEKGFRPEDSTVTVVAATTANRITDAGCDTAEGLLDYMAHCMDAPTTAGLPGTRSLLVLCPDHARVLARAGLSKADVKRGLFDRTRAIPQSRWPREIFESSIEGGYQRLEVVGSMRPQIVDGVGRVHDSPEAFEIIVAGGLGGYHSTWMPLWIHRTLPIRRVKQG